MQKSENIWRKKPGSERAMSRSYEQRQDKLCEKTDGHTGKEGDGWLSISQVRKIKEK